MSKTLKKPLLKTEKKVEFILLISFSAIAILSGAIFLHILSKYEVARKDYDNIKQSIIFTDDYVAAEQMTNEPAITYPNLKIDFKTLKATNPDFAGVIYIPVLKCCYPVAHSKDNDEYLNLTYDGKRSSVGCIFLDQYANGKYDEINTFLFGHNMKDGSMFGCLKRFLREEDLCDQDPFIYIYLEDKVLKYHIYCYELVPAKDPVYDDFPKDQYDWYVNRMLERNAYKQYYDSLKRYGIENEFKDKPKLLTLSTCYGYGHKQFTIVQATLWGAANTAVDTDFANFEFIVEEEE